MFQKLFPISVNSYVGWFTMKQWQVTKHTYAHAHTRSEQKTQLYLSNKGNKNN